MHLPIDGKNHGHFFNKLAQVLSPGFDPRFGNSGTPIAIEKPARGFVYQNTAESAGIGVRQLHKLLTRYGIRKEEFKNSTNETQGVLAENTSPKLAGFFTILNSAGNSSSENVSDEQVMFTGESGEPTAGNKVIKINLAWLILLVPFATLYIIRRRKLLSFKVLPVSKGNV